MGSRIACGIGLVSWPASASAASEQSAVLSSALDARFLALALDTAAEEIVEWINRDGSARQSGPSKLTLGSTIIDDDLMRRLKQVRSDAFAAVACAALPGTAGEDAAGLWRQARLRTTPVFVAIDLNAAPVDVPDGYLRLHLLSRCLIRPRAASFDGMFGVLPTLAWTSEGPFWPADLERLRSEQPELMRRVVVRSLDKFPPMLDYVLPVGVRIADASRVRLGAHLAEGTTVMHEGFVNANAGTLGPCMVEGRISMGVVVGASSDIGGGASIMGTMSGGGKEVVTIGDGCLLGANSGVGISLGSRCVVEAGLYLTAGSLVRLESGDVVKAKTLSGQDNLLFRRHSQTGAIEALVQRAVVWDGINPYVHDNN